MDEEDGGSVGFRCLRFGYCIEQRFTTDVSGWHNSNLLLCLNCQI